ncbi:hypothetical protein DICPUDRAFT_156106 [Dictyostelium purpureum]|uniref:Phosphatidylethanolamine-binding protein n=1 Tax=Dictyostelium purpureum TaxID=5786 RepID=F0ZVQ7_DICPU|nr:uncharacterized protein DICPUDRAFT_156106 [Dictyostelium purpureum]EGC31963.1 hypothetical protein DICPUDRAFT_156106 [Dictyostelium purpureum]|eukprot:XP_003291499.1 hypothetical protein DICPUDRAFT_156106 [Dictyostelium purpureum]
MIARLFGKYLLYNVHAGEEKCIFNLVPPNENEKTISLKSNNFEHDGFMPQKCAGLGVGDDISPHLSWSDLPEGTKEIILACEDVDAPVWVPILHASAVGIKPSIKEIPEGALNVGEKSSGKIEDMFIGVCNFRNIHGYIGPRPLNGHGKHRYIFEIYALSEPSGINQEKFTKDQLISSMKSKVIGRGRLDGFYIQE